MKIGRLGVYSIGGHWSIDWYNSKSIYSLYIEKKRPWKIDYTKIPRFLRLPNCPNLKFPNISKTIIEAQPMTIDLMAPYDPRTKNN